MRRCYCEGYFTAIATIATSCAIATIAPGAALTSVLTHPKSGGVIPLGPGYPFTPITAVAAIASITATGFKKD
ncbi:hypothetical protein [Endozoicomonas acroporae]|uniref:hypothetical protein n=1 Tax=Endozoicomonas acroporae TaxID=1701104 RepID=UPI003D79CC99